ncbi:MAG: hypothetical protein HDT01_01310 [Bacteroidales bacterium]|nr:hypothetical protein [Bacteroidales bacterium]
MSEEEKEILSNKITEGIREAQRRLFERMAKLGEKVVVGDDEGNPQLVDAKEVLARFNKH